jgi:uncharacterized protein (TIGR01244 family)
MKTSRLFLLCVLVGVVGVAGAAWFDHWRTHAIQPHPLTASISISEQLHPLAMATVAESGFTTVIDMRPDGEASDQPSSVEMARRAQALHLKFVYVPVPHGDIPESAVLALKTALADQKGPVLLYCRSGRRAARTWSLAEASRPGGLAAAEILGKVNATGQTADDLAPAIAARVSQRDSATGTVVQ